MKIFKLLSAIRLLKWIITIEEGYQDKYGYHSTVNDYQSDSDPYLSGQEMEEINGTIRRYYHGDSEDETTIKQKAEKYSQTHCN